MAGKNKTQRLGLWIKRQMVGGKMHFGGPEAIRAAKKLSLFGPASAYGMLQSLEKSGGFKLKRGVRGQGITVTLPDKPKAGRGTKPKRSRKKPAPKPAKERRLTRDQFLDELITREKMQLLVVEGMVEEKKERIAWLEAEKRTGNSNSL